MKKFLTMMLAVLTVFTMAACAKKQEQPPVVNQETIESVETPKTDGVQSTPSEEPMEVAQMAMDARNAYEYSGVLSLLHETCTKNVAARLRMDVEEMYAMYDENAAGIRQETEQDKGTFTVTGQLGTQTALEGEALTAIQERYEDLYELTVAEAVQVEFTVSYDFESCVEESKETMVIIQIDGMWYLDLASIKLL